MPTYTDPGFGAYLRTAPNLLAAYRERTGRALADRPRLITAWRALSDAAGRDNFSPMQVEEWLKDEEGSDSQDLADCQIYASIWTAR